MREHKDGVKTKTRRRGGGCESSKNTERTFLFSRWSGWFTSWAGVQGKNVVPLEGIKQTNRRGQGVCVMETHREQLL